MILDRSYSFQEDSVLELTDYILEAQQLVSEISEIHSDQVLKMTVRQHKAIVNEDTEVYKGSSVSFMRQVIELIDKLVDLVLMIKRKVILFVRRAITHFSGRAAEFFRQRKDGEIKHDMYGARDVLSDLIKIYDNFSSTPDSEMTTRMLSKARSGINVKYTQVSSIRGSVNDYDDYLEDARKLMDKIEEDVKDEETQIKGLKKIVEQERRKPEPDKARIREINSSIRVAKSKLSFIIAMSGAVSKNMRYYFSGVVKPKVDDQKEIKEVGGYLDGGN
jgi:hypothetical protein